MEEYELTKEERAHLDTLCQQLLAGELAQARDLIRNCNNKYQFAKTHSAYIKDWENTRSRMESDLAKGKLPPGVSAGMQKAAIAEMAKIIDAKLETVREAFQMKFRESIYNYLGSDGKTKFLGIF
ncbi:MAG: hypothetical protein Q7S05_00810 [bacterium]|nr:hypothetical protein [bacterium]